MTSDQEHIPGPARIVRMTLDENGMGSVELPMPEGTDLARVTVTGTYDAPKPSSAEVEIVEKLMAAASREDAAAKAIFDVRDDAYDLEEWEDLDSTEKEPYLCQARAALSAAERFDDLQTKRADEKPCYVRHPMGPNVSLAIPHFHPRTMKPGTTPNPPRK